MKSGSAHAVDDRGDDGRSNGQDGVRPDAMLFWSRRGSKMMGWRMVRGADMARGGFPGLISERIHH